MTPADALLELFARLGANRGAPVFIGAQELREWPASAVSAMQSHRVLVKARAATSAVCAGCERQCVMPVHLFPIEGRPPVAFIVCDKRDDINRVPVSVSDLEQWQASCETIADLLASVVSVRSSPSSRGASTWGIGLIRSGKSAGQLKMLLSDGELKLTLAGYSLSLREVLTLRGADFVIDRARLTRCVNHPVAGGGDPDTAADRRARLHRRVEEERFKGRRDFLKHVAAEEGISATRLKQLLKEKEPVHDVQKPPRPSLSRKKFQF